ncbi:MAG: hypothetical protein Q8P24_04695, partial [Desulfobacterales bacterium]|nr:hypothetical protein [Desulfobacterales bacterium]
PKKISPEKVPKSFEDMAKPQWKGKIGIPSATSGWTRRAFVLGKEKVFDELRGILKNDVILGRYSTLHNRFQLEEIWMAFTISSYWHYAITKGVPVAWQSLDYAEVPYYVLAVTKGSKHPNAAKLVAVYLASPAGAKFMLEESGTGNLFYPGNFENDFSVQNKKQGIREVFTAEDMKLINFIDSKDFNAWGKELKLLIDTGGTAKNKKKK